MYSKNKNSSPPSDSNKPNPNNHPKHSSKNSPLSNFNLKPNNNNSNSPNKRIPFSNKKSKRTKKIMKLSETNSLSHNSIKTTTLSSNIFPKELLNMNPKWSINLKEISPLKLKIQMPIMCSKTKLSTNSKFKMICFENNFKAKESNMTEKSLLNWKKRTWKDQRIYWKIQHFLPKLVT